MENDNARVVVIDSLNGYLNAMPDERFLILQMREFLTYLADVGRALRAALDRAPGVTTSPGI